MELSNLICKICGTPYIPNTNFYTKSCLCRKCYSKLWKQQNKDKVLLHKKKDREKNKEHIKKHAHDYYISHCEELKRKRRKYYHENKDIINEKRRNNSKIKIQAKIWRDNHVEEHRLAKREWNRQARQDSNYKLRESIGSLIRGSFKRACNGSYKKSIKTESILGCSLDDFVLYLQSKFYGDMTLDNYGTYWQIDHIKPISLATTEEEIYQLCHYTNLQPLTIKDNILKSNKYKEVS